MFKNFASAIALFAIGTYASSDEKPTAAGELHSKIPYKFGKFVASIKGSSALGTGSAFYLYDLNSFANSEDVFENWNSIAIVPSMALIDEDDKAAAIYSKTSKEDLNGGWEPYQDFTLDNEYHKFEIEWTPERLTYLIDDKVVRGADTGAGELDKELSLVMSICTLNSDVAGLGWDPTQEYYTDVDYVEVYRYDEAEKEFKLNFRDDFTNMDPERWTVADDKTWEAMDSIFKKENASVEGGRLRLKLDYNADYNTDGCDGGDNGDGGDGDDGGDGGDGDDSGDDSQDDKDFHVIPPPKDGTLEAAIEKATRVGVVVVREYLDHFSTSMAQHLQNMQ